jgi:hypothetical protein
VNQEQAIEIRPQPPRLHPATRWHRLVGIASTAVVLVTIATGVVLNHSDALNLAKRETRGTAIRHLYGNANVPLSPSYRVGRGWITQMGQRVFLDRAEILRREAPIVGAVETPDALLIAFEDGVVELDDGLNVVEAYGALDGLAPPLTRVGWNGDDAFVQAAAGIMQFDAATMAFVAGGGSTLRWQAASPLPDAISKDLVSNYGGPGVSYEQLLLDLHSGRLFGLPGVIIVDVAAICMLILGMTGVFLWFKFKRNNVPLRPKDFPSNPP